MYTKVHKTQVFDSNDTLEYPVKGPENGVGAYIDMFRNQIRKEEYFRLDEHVYSTEIKDGLHVIFHAPYEVPSQSQSFHFYTMIDQTIEIRIIPEMTTIDNSMIEFSPDE
jgi:hypothetical protein